MDKETLRSLPRPKELTRKGISELESRSLDELEREKVKKIIEVLTHPEFDEFIEEGRITLGLIKPNAHESSNLPPTDAEAAEVLLAEIGESAVFSFTTRLNREEAEEFYRPIKERYIDQPSERDPDISIWESTIRFTISGPVTFVLIYDEDGRAVDSWREKMGPTREYWLAPDSIRGKHALVGNLPNNLVHGSDSKESVRREVGVLVNHLKRITAV